MHKEMRKRREEKITKQQALDTVLSAKGFLMVKYSEDYNARLLLEELHDVTVYIQEKGK